MNMFRKAVGFWTQHRKVLGYSIVSLLTTGIEQIFSSMVFKCPCNSASGNMLYGLSFLLTPAIVLWLLGYMANDRTWLLVTGKCSQEKHLKCSHGRTCAHLCELTAKASVAPLTWIAVALLEASFYECAASGSSLTLYYFYKGNKTDFQTLLIKMPCHKELSAKIPSERLSLQAQSQLFGWFLMAAITIVTLTSICFSHCCSPVSYLQLKFWKTYSKTEHELFETKAKEHAKRLAEINTKCFFEAADPAPFHTPSREDWQKISFLHTFDSQEQCYSMIHKYVTTDGSKSTKLKKEVSSHKEEAD